MARIISSWLVQTLFDVSLALQKVQSWLQFTVGRSTKRFAFDAAARCSSVHTRRRVVRCSYIRLGRWSYAWIPASPLAARYDGVRPGHWRRTSQVWQTSPSVEPPRVDERAFGLSE